MSQRPFHFPLSLRLAHSPSEIFPSGLYSQEPWQIDKSKKFVHPASLIWVVVTSIVKKTTKVHQACQQEGVGKI